MGKAKTWQPQRWDALSYSYGGIDWEESADGDWIKVQDALDREAINADRIRTLEWQLKEVHRHLKGETDAT